MIVWTMSSKSDFVTKITFAGGGREVSNRGGVETSGEKVASALPGKAVLFLLMSSPVLGEYFPAFNVPLLVEGLEVWLIRFMTV